MGEISRDPIERKLDEARPPCERCPHLADGTCNGDNCKGVPAKA